MVKDTHGARNAIMCVSGVAQHEADDYIAEVLATAKAAR